MSELQIKLCLRGGDRLVHHICLRGGDKLVHHICE